jgi:hypothetical protein
MLRVYVVFCDGGGNASDATTRIRSLDESLAKLFPAYQPIDPLA